MPGLRPGGTAPEAFERGIENLGTALRTTFGQIPSSRRSRQPVVWRLRRFRKPPCGFAPLLLALAIALPVHAQPATTTIPQSALDGRCCGERALADRTGWNVVESPTTEVGPRTGSEADARARNGRRRKFKGAADKVIWTEPVTFPKWCAAANAPTCSARTRSRWSSPRSATALAERWRAEVVRFPDLAVGRRARRFARGQDRLRRLPDAALSRRPRLRRRRWRRRHPRQGPSAAIRKGAIGFSCVRLAPTPRAPHTGMTGSRTGWKPIPSAALSTIDAAQLSRLHRARPAHANRSPSTAVSRATTPRMIGEISGHAARWDEVGAGSGGHLIPGTRHRRD